MTKSCGNNILIINILMHMLILFTILNIFFNKFVKKLTTEVINNELIHSINDIFSANQDQIKQNQDQIKQNQDQNQNQIKQLREQLKNNNILLDSNYYEYYSKLFQNEDIQRTYINESVIDNINMFNITLVIIFILFLIFSFYYHLINQDNLAKIILENVLTFICIGIIEYLFFTHVAIQFIPVEPSYIAKSFINNMKKKLLE
jgi:hypothetical protein